MRRGFNSYGAFPHSWVAAATEIARKRQESNEGRRGTHQDRGDAQNLRGHVVGVLGERIAQWVRPDLDISFKVYASGADAPKVDTSTGVDVKSTEWGKPRILVNAKQALSLEGVVLVVIDIVGTRFWMSETIPGAAVRGWPVFDGPYGDPAHYRYQRDLLRI